jgi:hypothetical protein
MCEILTGHNTTCDNVGGVRRAYVFAVKDANGASNYAEGEPVVTDGNVTSISLVAGKYAYPFNFEMETANFNATGAGERPNSSHAIDQTATIVLAGNTAEMIVNIEALERGRHAVIFELEDGSHELFFMKNGAKVSDDRASGTAYTDLNGNTLNFTGREKNRPPKISATLVSTLLEPQGGE